MGFGIALTFSHSISGSKHTHTRTYPHPQLSSHRRADIETTLHDVQATGTCREKKSGETEKWAEHRTHTDTQIYWRNSLSIVLLAYPVPIHPPSMSWAAPFSCRNTLNGINKNEAKDTQRRDREWKICVTGYSLHFIFGIVLCKFIAKMKINKLFGAACCTEQSTSQRAQHALHHHRRVTKYIDIWKSPSDAWHTTYAIHLNPISTDSTYECIWMVCTCVVRGLQFVRCAAASHDSSCSQMEPNKIYS